MENWRGNHYESFDASKTFSKLLLLAWHFWDKLLYCLREKSTCTKLDKNGLVEIINCAWEDEFFYLLKVLIDLNKIELFKSIINFWKLNDIHTREVIIYLIKKSYIVDAVYLLNSRKDKLPKNYIFLIPILLQLKESWKKELAIEVFLWVYWPKLNEDQNKILEILENS